MSLYERHNYLDKNVEYIISQNVYEYDIKSANISLMKTFKLLDNKTIENISKMDKNERNITVGLMLKGNKELSKELNMCFVKARKKFFELNNLTVEDVLSIKKDAIFTTRKCHNTKLNEDVAFIEKNKYTSYYYLNQYEFYYNKDNLHVKGISDDKLILHEDYMLDSLRHFFMLNELQGDFKARERFLRQFITYYKNKSLNIGYYRELNSNSMYRLKRELCGKGDIMGINNTEDKNCIDIGYNYFNYIMPILNMIL